jgi:phosphonoacetaldehyde hydrolase
MNRIKAVILDWAGTTVDYGCFAPMDAFIAAFEAFGVKAGIDEIRAHMGLPKKLHIEKMLENRSLVDEWQKKQGRPHTQRDIDEIYARFETVLFEVLALHTDPLPGAIEAVKQIRNMGIAIGSTTGYTRAMMDVVVPLAKEKGYAPDCVICPEDAGGIGRPHPYMLWRNLEKLKVLSISSVLKVGDTAADMEEGRNAGALSAGILKGSSMLSLTEEELARKSEAEVSALFEKAGQKYMEAGADYVIEDISALPGLIESLNSGKGA